MSEIKSEILIALQEKLDEHKRRGVGNRCKYAKENETIGESKARHNGFLSGLLVAIDIAKRIETEAEERHAKQLQEVRDKAVEAHKQTRERLSNRDKCKTCKCACPIIGTDNASDYYGYMRYFLTKLNK